MGEILEDDLLRGDAHAIMIEAIALAKGLGVSLPVNIAEVSRLKARSFPYDAKTSFQRDYERLDKADERNLFSGTMLRIADELGIAVPNTRAVSTLLVKRKPAWSRAAEIP